MVTAIERRRRDPLPSVSSLSLHSIQPTPEIKAAAACTYPLVYTNSATNAAMRWKETVSAQSNLECGRGGGGDV